jgi:hypothetical protein
MQSLIAGRDRSQRLFQEPSAGGLALLVAVFN